MSGATSDGLEARGGHAVSLRNAITPLRAAITMKTKPTTGWPMEIQVAPAAMTCSIYPATGPSRSLLRMETP